MRAAVLRAAPALDESAVSLAVARPGVRGEPVTVLTYVAFDPGAVRLVAIPVRRVDDAQATDRQEFT